MKANFIFDVVIVVAVIALFITTDLKSAESFQRFIGYISVMIFLELVKMRRKDD